MPPCCRIEKLRKSLGMTQADLAAKIGLGQTDISKLESGQRDPLSLDVRHAMALAKALLSTVEELFGTPIPKKKKDGDEVIS